MVLISCYFCVFQKGDVEYISAKDMNPEIEAEMEYSTLFKQKVNLTSSSVHIPVEIFDGGKSNCKLDYLVEWAHSLYGALH